MMDFNDLIKSLFGKTNKNANQHDIPRVSFTLDDISDEEIVDVEEFYADEVDYEEEIDDDEYDDDDDDEYDDDDDDEEDDAENNICIHLNKYKIKFIKRALFKKFPKLKNIQGENCLEKILSGVFPDGFEKHMYIRNLTYSNNDGDVLTLGIRPERTHRDFLEDYIPNDVSLMFKGRVWGKKFIVDSIYDVANTERLDFEVDVNATQYEDPSRVYYNFLYDIPNEVDSLTKHTEEKLEEWKEYLKWKKELAERQIYGCKYYKVAFDNDTKRLNFWLVFENKESFYNFRKYLGRDIQVFDNDYSANEWTFEFQRETDNGRQRFNSVELGRYRGVVKEYELKSFDENEKLTNEEMPLEDNSRITDKYYFKDDKYKNVISEQDLYNAFDNPYIVQVAYELNRKDADEINRRSHDDEESYIHYVLDNYYSDGFLALSAIGEFALIGRFQRAIQRFERNECYSPNLAQWLFDVKSARVSNKEEAIPDRWLNPHIAENENQKTAVYKMLAAPDLCLVQGPPGTGKTTVIAEAIYQFVRRGDRVLVASQSNDAVDNALERLANTPEIRAVRLGQNSRKKRKAVSRSEKKFSEDEALKNYYNSLADQISETWLDTWNTLEKNSVVYDKDVRDAELSLENIAKYNNSIAELNKRLIKKQKEINDISEELSKANNFNNSLENDKRQLERAEQYFLGEGTPEFSFSEYMLRICEKELNDLIESTLKKGVYIIPEKLDLDVMGTDKERAYIILMKKNLTALKGLVEKIKNKKSSDSSADGELLLIKSELDKEMDRFLAIPDDDEDEKRKCDKKLRELKNRKLQLENSSSSIAISYYEKNILSEEMRENISGGNTDNIPKLLIGVIEEWDETVKTMLDQIAVGLENRQPADISPIEKKMMSAEGDLAVINEDIRNSEGFIKSSRETLIALCKKYSIKSQNEDEIISHIKRLREDNIRQLQKDKGIRNDWEETMRRFKERLVDEDAFEYDKRNYQEIYIKACNVVGISCTDNMRGLAENGYDDFDVVIIDEVSKATPPELLIPLMRARKAVLVGDHRQLPPMFREHEGSYKELAENREDAPEEVRELLTEENFHRFRNMVTSSLFKEYFEQADDSIKHSLLVQYRMHSDIMDIINRFYEQGLTCGLPKEVEEKEKSHGLTIKGVDRSSFIKPENHAYWIDSSRTPNGTPIYEVRPNNSTSNYNVLEKFIVIELLRRIADAYKEQGYGENKKKTVGVISFYQMQVNELREEFKNERKTYDFSAIDVDINTVDRFQGKEKNIIITSLVRNNKDAKASKHVVTFERINVAFSRAQELLVIVGAKHMYERLNIQLPNMNTGGYRTAPVYKNIMESLNRKGCLKSADKLITPELENEVLDEYQEYARYRKEKGYRKYQKNRGKI